MSFKKFLNEHKVFTSDKAKFNIQSLQGKHIKSGIFSIDINDRDEFINKYCKFVFNMGMESTLLECPFKPTNPPLYEDAAENSNLIKIDLDFKYKLDQKEREKKKYKRTYEIDDIVKFIEIYIKNLAKYIKITNKMKVYIMEKPSPTYDKKNDLKKDGIHIMIPGYLCPNAILYKVRNNCVKSDKVNQIFTVKNKCCNTLESIIDMRVIKTASWFLYGSGKPDDTVYKLTHFYDINRDEYKLNEIKNTESNIELVKTLSNLYVSKNVMVKDTTNLEELERLIDSNSKFDKMNQSFNQMMCKLPKGVISKPKSEVFSNRYTQNLVNCISPKRSEDYHTWWTIGQSLYNIDHRNLMIWKEFSKKCPEKYDGRVCDEHWLQFKRNHMKYSTLHINYLRKIAKEDNPHKMKIVDGNLETEVLLKILSEFSDNKYSTKQTPIGSATFSQKTKEFIETLGQKYYFACIHNEGSNTTWYKYDDHRWQIDNGACKLKKFITHKYLKTFKRHRNLYYEKIGEISRKIEEAQNPELNRKRFRDKDRKKKKSSDNESDDETETIASSSTMDPSNEFADDRAQNDRSVDIIQLSVEKDRAEMNMNVCNKIINFIESPAKRNDLVRDLGVEYNDPFFHQRLDTSTHIFICENGVLDLNNQNIHFRDGKPEDMMERSSEIKFITSEELNNDHKYQALQVGLQEFLDKIFPDEELQEYFLNIIAETLDGVPKTQEFYICTGTGSNGKTKFFELLQKAFGRYAGKISTTLLTRKRVDSGSANPELYDLRGKRVVYSEEPDENEDIKIGVMKELSGGGHITARTIYKHNITFIPQCKIFMNCNDIPDIQSTDDGTWRRIKVIKFLSKFVDKNDSRLKNKKKFPYCFPKEPVDDYFDEWAPILLSQLFERYKKIAAKGFKYPVPDCVNEAIEEYKSQQNVFSSYRVDRLVEVSGEKLDISEAFNDFKQYCRDNGFEHRDYNKNSFRTNIERILCCKAKNKTYFKNWQLASVDDGDDSDDDTVTEGEEQTDAIGDFIEIQNN